MSLHVVPISNDIRVAYIGHEVRVERRDPDGWYTDKRWDRLAVDDACELALAHARDLYDLEPCCCDDPSDYDLTEGYRGIR
jgi:hypothetical protein